MMKVEKLWMKGERIWQFINFCVYLNSIQIYMPRIYNLTKKLPISSEISHTLWI